MTTPDFKIYHIVQLKLEALDTGSKIDLLTFGVGSPEINSHLCNQEGSKPWDCALTWET